MKGPVVVTGATGFIGTRLVERLLDDGVPVRALVRSPARLSEGLRGRLQLYVGGLETTPLRQAMDGAGTVLHLAGLATAWAPNVSAYYEVNVEGVRRVLMAAEREAVDRVVHVSTVLTLLSNGTASTPYEASKRMGDRVVDRYVEAGGDAVTVHPCRVYGPGPLNDANGATKLIRSYLRGPVPVRLRDDGARGNWVHVDDVAEGIILAAQRGEPGRSYVLGGENCSVEELLELVAEVCGTQRSTVAIPPALALAMGGLLEVAGRFGAPVPITRGWVRGFLQDHSVDVGPTTEALDYHPRPLRDGLAQTVEWLRDRDGGE